MFAKLVVVVISFAILGAWLLSLRHERIQALSETTQAQLRIDRKDERLWMLRTKIAQRITPPQIEQMTAGLIDLQPIAPYKALSREQLAALTDDPPVGPPGLLNPELAFEEAQEEPGGAGGPPKQSIADGRKGPSGTQTPKASQTSGQKSTTSGKASGSTTKGTKQAAPAKSVRTGTKAAGSGTKAGAKPSTGTKAGSDTKSGTGSKAGSGKKSGSSPTSGSQPKKPTKTSPTRVARNDQKNAQEP